MNGDAQWVYADLLPPAPTAPLLFRGWTLMLLVSPLFGLSEGRWVSLGCHRGALTTSRLFSITP